MADKMDRGLDEIIADTRSNRPRNNRGQGRRREPRNDFPRDGVRKVDFPRSPMMPTRPSVRDDSRNIDSEWVHDRFEENNNRRAPAPRRRRESQEQDSKGTKIRVDNIHYDLTDDDLSELFQRIGPISRLQLRYDRAGRSEGTAYVTYERNEDARAAILEFDRANANGQPIYLTLLPSRNPFDTAVMPGRSLAERISSPGDRRSHSPHRQRDDDDAARRGIDRYVPGQGSRRSPMPRGRGQGQGQGRGQGGRRPGARRDGREGGREGGRDQEGGRGGRGNRPSKKTQEELDAEMADYFGGDSAPAEAANQQDAPPAQAPAAAQPQVHAAADDIDMIE